MLIPEHLEYISEVAASNRWKVSFVNENVIIRFDKYLSDLDIFNALIDLCLDEYVSQKHIRHKYSRVRWYNDTPCDAIISNQAYNDKHIIHIVDVAKEVKHQHEPSMLRIEEAHRQNGLTITRLLNEALSRSHETAGVKNNLRNICEAIEAIKVDSRWNSTELRRMASNRQLQSIVTFRLFIL